MLDRSARHRSAQQNVLLVDDDGSVATLHRRNLEARGYHVVETSDIDAALALARQAQPRIIFLTVDRLGSKRSPFLQALRRDDNTRHIPVTVLPAGHDHSLERLGLSRIGRELW
jgi:twitching motility two-component system response regulator PilH